MPKNCKQKTIAYWIVMDLDRQSVCIRDKIIFGLVDLHLTHKQICNMQLHEIATVPRETGGFIEAQTDIALCGNKMAIPPPLRTLIEDYVNVSQPVRPFHDFRPGLGNPTQSYFRPDIGYFLFPSAKSTGKGLSKQSISKIVGRHLLRSQETIQETTPPVTPWVGSS